MAYATVTDLSSRLGATLYARLTDRVNGASADATVAQTLVDEAISEADAYLARRYATPVDLALHAELAQPLRTRVLDVAEYRAWRSSPFVSSVPARVAANYRDALAWLEAVAAGRMVLPAASPPPDAQAFDDGPRYAPRTRIFTSEELNGL